MHKAATKVLVRHPNNILCIVNSIVILREMLLPASRYTSVLCLIISNLLSISMVSIHGEEVENFYGTVEGLAPHVFISVLVPNSMHILPNFFGYLEDLDYPKDRISVW